MPGQLVTIGVTVIVAVIVVFPELVAVNVGTFPVPELASPMAVLEFVHVKVPPAGTVAKLEAGIASALHTVIFAGTTAVGVGLTTMLYVDEVPGQLLTEGVTVIVPVIGLDPAFVAVNEGTFPVPPEPNPILVLELVHMKVPPAGILEKLVAATVLLLQTEMFAGTVTVGVGLTVIV